MKTKLTKLLLPAGFLLALLLFATWNRSPLAPSFSMSFSPASENLNPAKNSSGENSENLAPDSPPPGTPEATFNPQAASSEEFQTWLDAESGRLRGFSVDSAAKEQELKQTAAQLRPEQRRALLEAATNTALEIDRRIFSAYLLSISPEAAAPELSQLAAADLILAARPEPHTVGETQNTQERALRILAINRLADLAKDSVPARQELAKLIPRIKDASLRDYASQKNQQIEDPGSESH